MFPSTPSLTTYQKLMDLDLEPVFLIESLCFSFFVGVGWDGVGGNTMSNLSIGGF